MEPLLRCGQFIRNFRYYIRASESNDMMVVYPINLIGLYPHLSNGELYIAGA